MTQMLYKSPGPHEWPQHGGSFEYMVVDEAGIDQALLDGWFMTTGEALASVGEKMPDLITHDDAWNILDENVPFDGMDLAPRTITALAKNGITVTKQLRELSDDQLIAMNGIGKSMVADINEGFELMQRRLDGLD